LSRIHRLVDAIDLLGQFDELGKLPPEAVSAADACALVLQRRAADVPTLPTVADLPRHRRFGIIEEKFAKSVVAFLAGHLADRAPCDAGLVEIDQQIGDAVVLRRVRFGADEHEHMRRLHALRGPDLLSVDDPLAAVGRQFALGANAREIRPRSRFGITLPPDIVALYGPPNEQVFLLVGPLFEQSRHGHVHAVAAHLHRRAGAGEFLADHLRLDNIDRLLRSAITLWNGTIEIARVGCRGAEGADERLEIGPAQIGSGRPVRRQKGANLRAKGFGGLAIAQVHRTLSLVCGESYAELYNYVKHVVCLRALD
jgi:hypothetical protein